MKAPKNEVAFRPAKTDTVNSMKTQRQQDLTSMFNGQLKSNLAVLSRMKDNLIFKSTKVLTEQQKHLKIITLFYSWRNKQEKLHF